MPRTARTSGTSRTGFGLVLEVAYLFCYPLVPLGLLAMYAAGQRDHVASFWLVVLIATYLCYAMTPFVPAYPPRDLAGGQAAPAQAGKARVFNRWILKHGSIHAISFPSAHVASTFAVSLVLLRFAPLLGRGLPVCIDLDCFGRGGRAAITMRWMCCWERSTALAVFLACFL